MSSFVNRFRNAGKQFNPIFKNSIAAGRFTSYSRTRDFDAVIEVQHSLTCNPFPDVDILGSAATDSNVIHLCDQACQVAAKTSKLATLPPGNRMVNSAS